MSDKDLDTALVVLEFMGYEEFYESSIAVKVGAISLVLE